MKIVRADLNDTDIFSAGQLAHGACCFYTEDRAQTYFFEIKRQSAILYTKSDTCITEVINEFLFYSGFVTIIKNQSGGILYQHAAAKPEIKPYLCKITDIRPSQFYISEDKLAACKTWITRPEDIMIPVVIRDGVYISQDGHTRLRAASDMGFDSVCIYPESYDVYIFDFADEAARRGIHSVLDMEVVSAEDYVIKWHKYCDEFFMNKE